MTTKYISIETVRKRIEDLLSEYAEQQRRVEQEAQEPTPSTSGLSQAGNSSNSRTVPSVRENAELENGRASNQSAREDSDVENDNDGHPPANDDDEQPEAQPADDTNGETVPVPLRRRRRAMIFRRRVLTRNRPLSTRNSPTEMDLEEDKWIRATEILWNQNNFFFFFFQFFFLITFYFKSKFN